MPENTQLAEQAPRGPLVTFQEILEANKVQIARALPRHLSAERMIRTALTILKGNKKLLECTADSVGGCVVQAAELSLELSGPLGQCYMVPYWSKERHCRVATFQVGYRGLMDLAYRSGRVLSMAVRVIHANDTYRITYGTQARLDHAPVLGDRGPPIAYYAVMHLKGGVYDFEVMSLQEIEEHRNAHAKGFDKADSPWATAFDEMAKKTPLRRLAKRAPMSVDLTRAAVLDEYGEAGVDQKLGNKLLVNMDQPEQLPTGRQRLQRNGSADTPAAPAEVIDAAPALPENHLAEDILDRIVGAESEEELADAVQGVSRYERELGEHYGRVVEAYRKRRGELGLPVVNP